MEGSERQGAKNGTAWGVVFLLCLLLLLALCGCNTLEQAEQLPLEWWVGLEALVWEGLVADIVSVLSWFFA